MSKAKRRFLTIIIESLVILLLSFFFSFTLSSDPDLGWHLRNGKEIVLQRKISQFDAYTHTLYGKRLVNNEWLIEAAFYLIYSHFSLLGLSLFSTLAVFLAFLLPVVGFSRSKPFLDITAVAIALLAGESVLRNGAKVQIIAWVFLSVVVVLLVKFLKNKKKKFLLPLPFVFLFWANSHQSYLLGLFLVGLAFLGFVLEKRQVSPLFLLMVLLSLIFSCFNPAIGQTLRGLSRLVVGLVLPVNKAVGLAPTQSVRKTILEWLPLYFPRKSGVFYLLEVFFLVSIFLLSSRKKFSLGEILISFFLIYFSSLARRNAPFLSFIFLPLFVSSTGSLKSLLPHFFYRVKFLFIIKIALLGVLLTPVVINLPRKVLSVVQNSASFSNYCQATSYPCKAVEFIKDNPIEGRMFNPYNWGGFLIWQLPEQRVFIDGRMPGSKIFEDYRRIESLAEGWESLLEKHKVGWMLLPKNSILGKILLEDKGWKKEYEDEQAIVLTKK